MDLEVTHLFENSHGSWYLGVAVNGHDLGELVHGGLGELEWQSLIQETSRNSSSMISTPLPPCFFLGWFLAMVKRHRGAAEAEQKFSLLYHKRLDIPEQGVNQAGQERPLSLALVPFQGHQPYWISVCTDDLIAP